MSKPQPNAKEAYDAGAKAKRRGFMRVTPYYEQPRSGYWWLAGFDGVEFFQAEKEQPDFNSIFGPIFDPMDVHLVPTISKEESFKNANEVCGYHTPIPVKRPEFMSLDILQDDIETC